MKRILGIRKAICAWLIVSMLAAAAGPGLVYAAGAADDLKQIEYQYYFRGKYQQSIEALQTFLARVDITEGEAARAREFLAASYVLGGAPAMGKEVFMQIIKANASYTGPDPTVFKLEVVNTYAEARADYTSMTLKNANPTSQPLSMTDGETATAQEAKGKPIYKKWWFYAGAASALLIAGVVSGGKDGGGTGGAGPSGTVTVGVNLK